MKINIHNTTYIFMLLSFLSGYFEYIYILLLIIIVHEIGHFVFGKVVKLNPKEIIIYPFGGITKYNELLNTNIYKELFMLLGGIVFQTLFFLLVTHLFNISFVSINTYHLFKNINLLLISFNFLPVLPLDGGRLVNIILDKILCYKDSLKITIIISIISSIYFIYRNINVLNIILFIFLVKSIILEILNINNKYNKFLLERYLYEISYNKIKFISNINRFKRDYFHFINNISERVVLKEYFKCKK